MDFKFKGRTWAGNIYHKFETMCQEVDDFVTKDSVKYVENQVQTVGESMKKLYSNVVHDFLPTVVDNKPNEGQLVTKKQNDVLRTYIRSMVGIKGMHGHVNERKSFKEKSNASEVDHQRQHSLPPNLPFQQHEETDFYSEDDCNICTSKNGKVVHEENVTEEESAVSRFSSSQDEKSSLNLREQHPLPENLDSPENENFSGAPEISNDGDQKCILLTKCSPEKSREDVDFRTSQNDETECNNDDLSEEAKTGLSLEPDGANAIYKSAKMGPEENVTNKEHHMSEGANTFREKDSSELTSCTKEHQMADHSHLPPDDNSLVQSSANEDFKSSMRGKLSTAMLAHDTRLGVVQVEETVCDIAYPSDEAEARLRVVQVEETLCDNADPSEEAEANLSSEVPDNAAKLGFNLEENVLKDVPLVIECKSLSDNSSCPMLSLCSREQCPLFEELSNLEVGKFSESSLIPTNENPKVTSWAKFPPATSVHNQELRVADASKEAEEEFSWEIDGDSICMCSDLVGVENCMLSEYAVEEHISPPELKSSCDLSLRSVKLHLPAEGLDSLEDDNLLKSSQPLSDKDRKNIVLTNFSPATSVHDAELGAYGADETIFSRNPSYELVASNVCVDNKITKAKVTSLNSPVSKESLNLPDISYAKYTQKAKKSSYNYTDSSSCASFISSISSASFSDLVYDDEAVNLIPAFPSRAVSAVSGGHEDDTALDIADPDMETIDLSDKVNLDESCIIVGNRLHYAASSRPRKFKSYTKLIQDAFASRKRLIKEYEQLAIWYGDIEMETCPHPKEILFPPFTAITSSSRTSQTSDMCEPDWEIL